MKVELMESDVALRNDQAWAKFALLAGSAFRNLRQENLQDHLSIYLLIYLSFVVYNNPVFWMAFEFLFVCFLYHSFWVVFRVLFVHRLFLNELLYIIHTQAKK